MNNGKTARPEQEPFQLRNTLETPAFFSLQPAALLLQQQCVGSFVVKPAIGVAMRTTMRSSGAVRHRSTAMAWIVPMDVDDAHRADSHRDGEPAIDQ